LEQIIQNLISFFSGNFSKELIIFLISIFPVIELRGGLIAASFLHVNWQTALILCVLGNILPVPFILIFINKIFEILKRTRFLKLINKLENKANKKAEKILKYEKLGLFLFVAIPLPGTGAWTGALIAALLKMKLKDAFFSIFFGVLVAGIIMLILSYGILNSL